jgi:ABC-type multidrug transport system fused ATPase/permease subunit
MLALHAAEDYVGKFKLLIGVSFVNALLESATLILLFGMLTSMTGGGSQEGKLYEIIHYISANNYLYLAIIILIAATIRYVLGLWVEWNMNELWTRLREKFQNQMMERHLTSPLRYLLLKKTGEHVHNIMDVPSLAAVFYLHYVRFLSSGLMFSVLLITLFFISPSLIVTASVIALLYAVVIKKTSENIAYKMGKQHSEAIKIERELVTEGLYGIRYIKIFNLIKKWQREFGGYTNTAATSMQRAGYWYTLPNRTMEYFLIFVFMLLIIYGLLHQSDVTSAIPTLAVYFLTIVRILPSLSILGNGRMQMMNALPNLEKIIQLRNEIPVEGVNHGTCAPPSLNCSVIEYHNVSYSYDKKEVLKNVNFQIAPRKITVIVGATGHGKSTIIDLLLRFIEPKDGEIRINGKKINDYELTSWWKKFAYVGQEPFLLHGSIRENLCIGDMSFNDEEMLLAARCACIDDYIERLPEKWDTVLAERGLSLSGGQKQRLALARAFLTRSDVILLDEPTSALDFETESRIITNLTRLKEKKTIVMVTHRLEMARKADTILLIKDGSLHAEGKFSHLMKESAYFRKIYGLDDVALIPE